MSVHEHTLRVPVIPASLVDFITFDEDTFYASATYSEYTVLTHDQVLVYVTTVDEEATQGSYINKHLFADGDEFSNLEALRTYFNTLIDTLTANTGECSIISHTSNVELECRDIGDEEYHDRLKTVFITRISSEVSTFVSLYNEYIDTEKELLIFNEKVVNEGL